ncbi:MAG TPA: DUF4167 domain-containing protein [Devosiaceae bacterium]|jgi:hypothetical protein
MRPNQQNNKNRSRGRNNNGGRKHINPLSRNFESNGPDVKVRGNASHIAEKYLQLARDAQSSGDSVMAENYLQHAEHYFRIVSAAQPQGMQRSDQFNADVDGDDDEFDPGDSNSRFNSRFSAPAGNQNQNDADSNEQGDDSEQVEAPAAPVVVAAPVEAQAPAEGEGEPRRRERRPRRRRTAGAEGNAGDPAAAEQPDVGELPAFITAGGATTAAE